MKKIEAIIKPFKLEELKGVLSGLNVAGMTISEVKGFGRQKGYTEICRGAGYVADFIPKVKAEIVLAASQADEVVTTIMNSVRTGEKGRDAI